MRDCYPDVDGLRMHYVEAGDADNRDVLVLLHGGTETARSRWEPVLPTFAERFRVLAVDSRGHGESGNDGRPLTYRLLANDMAALCTVLTIDRPMWCGFSDGANVVLELAMRHPAVVAAGVLHGCILDFTPSYHEAINAYLAGLPRHEAAMIGPLWLTPLQYDDSDYAAVRSPLLVLNGDGDEFTTVEEQRTLHARLPGSELVLMPGTGHGFPADLGAYVREITEFLLRARG